MRKEELDLREEAKVYKDKLEKIKICLFDVDGILTDGKLHWAGEEVGYNRQFHTHDGYGMKMLMRAGIKVGIITGGDSLGVKKRFSDIGVNYIYSGNEDKRQALDEIIAKENISLEEVLYMGDEFFDLPLLQKVGFSATVPNASIEIREAVDYISHRKSGEACAREVMDLVRHIQKIVPAIEF